MVEDPSLLFSALPAEAQEEAYHKLAYVRAVLELRERGSFKLTDEAYAANQPHLVAEAVQQMQLLLGTTKSHASRPIALGLCPSLRRLRDWKKAYEQGGLTALVGKRHRRGNRSRRIGDDEQRLMSQQIERYLNGEFESKDGIYIALAAKIAEVNGAKDALGLPRLVCPSRETVRRTVAGLDPYQVCLRREGPEAARKKFAPVGRGLETAFHALSRVEMDEWTVDLMTLFPEADLMELLSDADRELLEKKGKNAFRWVLSIAICASTRCILGMVLTPSARKSAALQVLKMVLADKGQLASEAGSTSPWNMFGRPWLIVTDNGSAYLHYDFQRACLDLGITTQRAPAGIPELRATIERMVRTFSTSALKFAIGRTFGSVEEKGEADPAERAALTVDDLAMLLVRWVVDIYHNTPHRGLNGMTPAEAWKQATEKTGVVAPPDVDTARIVFGERFFRRVSKSGVEVLGVNYHSQGLAEHFLRRDSEELEVRWLPSDIGAISVRFGRSEWQTLHATTEGLSGVRAVYWLQAVRKLQMAKQGRNEFREKVVLDAVRDIQEQVKAARGSAGLLIEDWDDKRLQSEEKRLFVGFKLTNPVAPKQSQSELGRAIPDLADHETPTAIAPPNPTKTTETPRKSGNFKLED